MYNRFGVSVLLMAAASVVLAKSQEGGSYSQQLDPWNDEFANTPDLSFSGVASFAHLPHKRCLDVKDAAFDIALLGVPFDSAVSFRPGTWTCLYSWNHRR